MYKYDEKHLISFYRKRDYDDIYCEKDLIKFNILKTQNNDLVKNCEKEKILKFNQRCNRDIQLMIIMISLYLLLKIKELLFFTSIVCVF